MRKVLVLLILVCVALVFFCHSSYAPKCPLCVPVSAQHIALAHPIFIPHPAVKPLPNFEAQAQAATGALFVGDRFLCSGTEIGHVGSDGYFLTARHCVADYDTNKIEPPEWLSFTGNEKGPYYSIKPVALSLTDDLAILRVVNGAAIPEVQVIGDERKLNSGDPIFNSSFPLGMGKLVFHGEFMRPNFEKIDENFKANGWGDQWDNTMPMNLTIAPGSSGSGVFSSKQRALIAVAVGSFREGEFNIAVPATRVRYLLTHLKDNSVDAFVKARPVKSVCQQIDDFKVCPANTQDK